MPAGRPTKYSEDILSKTQQYIDSCEDVEDQVVSGESEKFTAYKVRLRVKLPTIEGLAYFLRVHKDTIFEWEKVHDEFSDLLNILRGKQFQELVNKSLAGDYNPAITKLLLSKHGYADKQEVDSNVKQTIEVQWDKGLLPPPIA